MNSNKIYSLYPDLKYNNSISLHVRRGDYLSKPDYHPVVSKSYFDKCLNLIGEYDRIYVFSDDKEWVRDNLNYDKMIIVDGLYDYEDIWMMSLCKTNIISNSSFSWWGGFLSKHTQVYAPSVWFGPMGPKNHFDLYKPEWKIVATEYSNGSIL